MDSDSVKYGYGEPDGREDDSPDQLTSYRREYAATMADLQLPTTDYHLDDTRLSHIVEAIEISVEDTICRPWIIKKFLGFAFGGNVSFTFPEFSDAWLVNQAGDWMDAVKEAFREMWHAVEDMQYANLLCVWS